MAARWDRSSSTEGSERPRPRGREERKESERKCPKTRGRETKERGRPRGKQMNTRTKGGGRERKEGRTERTSDPREADAERLLDEREQDLDRFRLHLLVAGQRPHDRPAWGRLFVAA